MKQQAQQQVNATADQKTCPLDGNCFIDFRHNLPATITRKHYYREEIYIKLTNNTFKARYNGHISSFKNDKKSSTMFSQYIRTLKSKQIAFNIQNGN